MDQDNVSAVSARAHGHRILALVARWAITFIKPHHFPSWSSIVIGGGLALLVANFSNATTYYTYDSLGRVTQAVESNGTTTQYTYDADGNITSITRTAGSSTLSIGAISTTSGAVGSSITINGSGFSSIPSQNTVTINGVAAQVTYASDNRLVITIPSGATTGDVEITTQTGSITSSTPLTVVPVSVSSFSPTSAAPGATVTLNGGGFDPTPANNTVLINGVAATVATATATQLQITVPSGATPGHISVSNSQGSGVSSADLFVPAPGYTLSQIAQVAVLAPAGTGHVYTINTNQVAVALFDGTVGQRMSLIATNLSVGGRYTVFAPDGSTLVSDGISTLTGSAVNLPPLSMAGTFAFYFVSGSTPGTATFKLQTDVVGNLATDGAPTPTSLVPGQSATYTFQGTAGRSYNLALTAFAGASTVNATLYKPDGSYLINCGTYQAYYNYTQHCDFTLGTTGTYTLRIVPYAGGLYSSSFNTFLVQDFSAALTSGTPGPTVGVSLVPNQHDLLSFTATANQTLALYFGPASINPNGPLQFNITGPGNTSVTGNSVSNGGSVTFNLTNLAAGNYTTLVAPYSNDSAASVQAALANGITATLPVNGTTSSVFQTYVPGQAAYFTFPATAGQSVGLALSQLALTPGSVNSANIGIYKPDTGYYTSGTCYLGTTPACQMSLRNLPQTGNYQIVVTPNGQATMALAMTLSQDQAGTLTLGTAANVNLTSPGQNGLFTFTLTGSQALVLSGASISTTPANTPVTVYVYDANNNLVQYSSMTGSSGTMNLGTLPAGTYSVLVVPNNGATGSMNLTVQPAQTTSVPTDGSSTNISTSVPGQNAYVTFFANAGDSITAEITNITLSPATATTVNWSLTAPDNSTVWNQNPCTSTTPLGCNADVMIAPQTGTYKITVGPPGQQTLSFAATVARNLTGTLTPGAAQTINFSTPLGQAARFAFTITSGEVLAISLTGITTTPSNTQIWMGVYTSTGSYVIGNTTYTGEVLNLTSLAPGNYILWIGDLTMANATMQLSFQPGVTNTLPTDGSSTSISTLAPGQNAYLKFAANAGDSISAVLTNLALSPSSPTYLNWSISAPDGSTLGGQASCYTTTAPGCYGNVMTAPVTGTYTINVMPVALQTASFTMTVAKNLTGTLTTPATQAINFSAQTGQDARFTVTVASGQSLTASLAGITTTPANTQVWMGVYTPSGSYVGPGGSTTTGETLNINLSPGTYILWIGNISLANTTMQFSFH